MACITVNDEVQSTFSIKELEKAIHNICSESDFIKKIPTPIGTKTIIADKVTFICPSQIQEDINKEIINSLYSYKPFSKYLTGKNCNERN